MGVFDDILGAPSKALGAVTGGKNDYRAEAYKTDQNAFEYGGHKGGADEAANRYASGERTAQGRNGAQAQYDGADASRGLQARDQQTGALDLQRQAALGQAPSMAAILGRQQSDQAAAAQQSLAAGARGPAAMALAQQNAAANTANAQTQIAGQAMAGRAGEMAQARDAYQQGASGLRGHDLASQQQNAQQSQFNAGLQQQQHGLNDAYSMANMQAEQNVRNSQLTAKGNEQQINAGATSAANNANAGITGQNSKNSIDVLEKTAKAVSGGLVSPSDENTKFSLSSLLKQSGGAYGGHQGGKGYGPESMTTDPSMSWFGGHEHGAGYAPTASADPGTAGSPATGVLSNVMAPTAAPAAAGATEAAGAASAAAPAAAEGAAAAGGLAALLPSAAALSDETSKVTTTSGKEFAAPSPKDAEQYLASTRGAVYQYKDPSMPGARPGPQVGPPSAQDMAKTDIGRTMVQPDPNSGVLSIDKDKALKTGMSMDSYLNDKINGLARILSKGKK